MIDYKTGNILAEDVEALVNTVNCVGVMGRGIALQFKNAFPENFERYAEACERGEVEPGRMFVFETGGLTNPRYIVNFPTKRHWRAKSRIEDIERGLEALQAEIRARDIRSIALPPLGAGLGGLDWSSVRERIEAALGDMNDRRVVVYEPAGAPPAAEMPRPKRAPGMTPGRAALIGLIHRYRAGLLDPFVTLLEVHKLLYFMQEAGEPLRLRYRAAEYGPYAENLRDVLREVEGYYLTGYADGGDAPDKQLDLVPGARQDAEAFLADHPDTRARFDRVSELVDGFETPFGLELLATVYWILKEDPSAPRMIVVDRTHAWSPRKRQFTARQIGVAMDALAAKGWCSPGAGGN